MLDRPDWSRIDKLLDSALDVPSEDRPRWLRDACGDDAELRSRLEALVELAEKDDDALSPQGAMHGPVWDDVVRVLREKPAEPELAVGAMIGPYEVLAPLGSGGMGRVVRARDARLGREVAIKTLAHTFRGDAASLRRFEREARALATLNHPNIASIYEVLHVEDHPYLVLELVEGPTLADRLSRGGLELEEAVAISVQLADALEEAHRKGIVHRDLKPSNVILDASGRVKVLDFGLAKSHPSTGDEDPTTASTPEAPSTTRSGAILGTAPYMSPEQARGLQVDSRTDVWAFGCLLYEMLAGVRAFRGRSVSDVLAAVLRDDPDWSRLPPTTPLPVRRVLRRCLQKDPRRRLQDVGDARLDLEEPDDGEPVAPLPPAAPRSRIGSLLPWILAALAACAALAFAWHAATRAPAAGRRARLHLELGPGLTLAADFTSPFALSRDGSMLVYVGVEGGVSRLYARPLDRVEASAIPGTEGATQPFFSPDGRSVAFFADRKLKKVALEGGSPVTLAEVGGNPRGAGWGPDGTIVLALSQTSGLSLVSDRGGALRELTRLDAATERSHRWPQFLADGSAVLFTVQGEDATFDDAAIAAVTIPTGERRTLLQGGSYGRALPSGHLVFARAGRLLAVPFDGRRLVAGERPEAVVDGIAYDSRNGATRLALAEDGTLVYLSAPPTSLEHHLAWIDPSGRLTRISDAPRRYSDPRVARDGRRAAVLIGPSSGADAWVLDHETRTLSQLTFGIAPHRPAWTPDGAAVTVGWRDGPLWRLSSVPLDEPGRGVAFHETPNRVYPNDWSSDGRRLLFQERRPATGWDVGLLELGEGGRPSSGPRWLLDSPYNEENGCFSPDGRWFAYESDEVDAVVQVYVSPLDRPSRRVRVSNEGGRWPRWGRTGELFYWQTGDRYMRRVAWRVEDDGWQVVAEGPAWEESSSESVPVSHRVYPPILAGYDRDPSSGRFLMMELNEPLPEPRSERAVVVFGWIDELRARFANR